MFDSALGYVLVGVHNLDKMGEQVDPTIPERIFSVANITIHEHYNNMGTTVENDIALLHLSEAVDLALHTPACIAQAEDTFTGLTGQVYGWGRTSEDGDASNTLLEVNVTVGSHQECNTKQVGLCQSSPDQPQIPCQKFFDSMFCAGGVEDKDSCEVSNSTKSC